MCAATSTGLGLVTAVTFLPHTHAPPCPPPQAPVPRVEVVPVAQPSCWASCFGLAGPPRDAAFSHAQLQAHGGQQPMQHGPPPQVGGREGANARGQHV